MKLGVTHALIRNNSYVLIATQFQRGRFLFSYRNVAFTDLLMFMHDQVSRCNQLCQDLDRSFSSSRFFRF